MFVVFNLFCFFFFFLKKKLGGGGEGGGVGGCFDYLPLPVPVCHCL